MLLLKAYSAWTIPISAKASSSNYKEFGLKKKLFEIYFKFKTNLKIHFNFIFVFFALFRLSVLTNCQLTTLWIDVAQGFYTSLLDILLHIYHHLPLYNIMLINEVIICTFIFFFEFSVYALFFVLRKRLKIVWNGNKWRQNCATSN